MQQLTNRHYSCLHVSTLNQGSPVKGIGHSPKRTFRAPAPETCTNCSDGISPGEYVTWAWGGQCHVRCLKLGSPATRSVCERIESEKPILSDREGVCAGCQLKYYPGSPLQRSGNRYLHRHCATRTD
jgi:hypothetical protein